jgi:hypothetical protein
MKRRIQEVAAIEDGKKESRVVRRQPDWSETSVRL